MAWQDEVRAQQKEQKKKIKSQEKERTNTLNKLNELWEEILRQNESLPEDLRLPVGCEQVYYESGSPIGKFAFIGRGKCLINFNNNIAFGYNNPIDGLWQNRKVFVVHSSYDENSGTFSAIGASEYAKHKYDPESEDSVSYKIDKSSIPILLRNL